MKGLEKVSEKVRSKQGGWKDDRDRGRNDTHTGQGGRVQQLGVWEELEEANVGDVLDELWQNWRRASWPVPGGQDKVHWSHCGLHEVGGRKGQKDLPGRRG